MKKMTLALDWTANTNHSGFYVAKTMGFYAEEGLEVELLTPDRDNYALTPAKKVELGSADLALCPFESVLSYRTKQKAFDAVAVAAIFREDVSAIAVLEGSGIERPKDLDHRSYASYQARYEDHIVAQMVKNDGGTGSLQWAYPEKLGIWETLCSGKYDATWIFMNWEGVHAEAKGIPLRTFKMADYGIPYGYSPVLLASRARIALDREGYRSFLRATKRGFMAVKADARLAVDCLQAFIAPADKDIDLLKSQEFANAYYGDDKNWGRLEQNGVADYLNWLRAQGLETSSLGYSNLVVGDLL